MLDKHGDENNLPCFTCFTKKNIWRKLTATSWASITFARQMTTTTYTCATLQWDTLALPQLVSRAATETVVFHQADSTEGRTRLALLPLWVVEALRTSVPTLTLEEVPEHPKFICTYIYSKENQPGVTYKQDFNAQLKKKKKKILRFRYCCFTVTCSLISKHKTWV